jgi:hypothetical protein
MESGTDSTRQHNCYASWLSNSFSGNNKDSIRVGLSESVRQRVHLRTTYPATKGVSTSETGFFQVGTAVGRVVGYANLYLFSDDFAYRVEVGWWVFALAGALALLIALLTVSFQSIRAALMNPVKSLRSE